MTTIKFTADQVAALGLPRRGAYVAYDDQGRLDDFSTWLIKQPSYAPGIDKLIELADHTLPTLH